MIVTLSGDSGSLEGKLYPLAKPRRLVLEREQQQRAGVESHRQGPWRPALSGQAAFQLGIFFWHLCVQALKIAHKVSAAKPAPQQRLAPFMAGKHLLPSEAVDNYSSGLSQWRLFLSPKGGP